MVIRAALHSPHLFDSESFTRILPFDQDNPLDAQVQSDHAEIALRTPAGRIINIWNISNPAYHSYFQYGHTAPFHQTHLFINQPYVNGVMDERLAAKADSQASTIAERFVRGEVSIQVIVEGYESFYQTLSAKIKALGHLQFEIISLLDKKPAKWKAEWNVTAILIDTSRFVILSSGIGFGKYDEVEDGNQEHLFFLPYARVCDKKTADNMIIAGVHIDGCASQYPRTGLESLAQAIVGLRFQTSGECDIIAAGDYNTSVLNARESAIPTSGTVLKAPYPTHVNPNSQVANYDQVSILPAMGSRAKARLQKYEMLPASHLSAASQSLISSIERSRQKYLTKHGLSGFIKADNPSRLAARL